MEKVIASRITEARESRALSMEDLAESINVTRQTVSKYEKGVVSPSPDVLLDISHTLDFPVDFFYKNNPGNNTADGALFFRSNSTVRKKVKVACNYQIKWVDEIKQQLEEYVDFVEQGIPVIDGEYEDLTENDIEDLALSIRKSWGLADYPITDLIGLLENKGVIVAEFCPNKHCEFKGVDAFSSWKNGTPYILYHAEQKSAVRTRFSILHELGHLIMHSSISARDAEKKNIVDLADAQADRFAAAFLLPATSFPKDLRGTSLTMLEIMKRKWGAAMSTIIKRCETLDLLTESQIDYMKRQMTTQRYWHREPLDDVLTIAAPEILRDAVTMLIDNGIITKEIFINKSAFNAADLTCICGLPSDFFGAEVARKKPILRIVSSNNVG